ncbi:class I SAM-dependent methyltransferase [Kribbella sp. NPDC051952]|uniref:class I SAM-dependent methyltransferase n=1 Tax=Kribbella sp. NPDC051952 TaxID=3154851 RepID=UPI003417562F
MKYYYAEHEDAYRRLRAEGLAQWSALFGEAEGFDAFPNREFLEDALSRLDVSGDVLEYGCGTGPAACYLAARGFRVEAIDLIPQAIELARGFAAERGLEVDFGVQDICELADEPAGKQYDLIVDSYVLQSIVMDDDRARLFAAVRARLKGFYLISTAVYEPERVYGDGFRYDASSGICYQGDRDVPHRRHLPASALRAEIERAGFEVVSQDGGNLVCTI